MMMYVTRNFILFLFILFNCSNHNPVDLLHSLNGTWVEIYYCKNVHCINAVDSLQVAVLSISGSKITSTLYRDSEQNFLDSSFSGKISISNDTLEFILNNSREVFNWTFLRENIFLNSEYYIDVKGNKIIDFRSILWCCEDKKRGIFKPSGFEHR